MVNKGSNSENLYLVTAQHVVYNPDKIERKTSSQQRHNIVLFGDAASKKYLDSIKAKIEGRQLWKSICRGVSTGSSGRKAPLPLAVISSPKTLR